MPEHGFTERETDEPDLSSVPTRELDVLVVMHTKTIEHAQKYLRYYERELDRRCADCGTPLKLNMHGDHVCANERCFLHLPANYTPT